MERLAICLFAMSVAVSCTATMDDRPAPPPVQIPPAAPVLEVPEPDFVFQDDVVNNPGFIDGMECRRVGASPDACRAVCESKSGKNRDGCLTAQEIYDNADSFRENGLQNPSD